MTMTAEIATETPAPFFVRDIILGRLQLSCILLLKDHSTIRIDVTLK